MTYFINAVQRKTHGGTCYFEFQKGKHKGKHWKEDSLYLHADVFEELHLFPLFDQAIPKFNCFGPTPVTQSQYELLRVAAQAVGGEVFNAIAELNDWAEECFSDEKVFTILGI